MDIRKFFSPSSKKTSEKSKVVDKPEPKKSRKLRVLDSDSDDEPSPKGKKRSLSQKSPKGTSSKKDDKKEEVSKYFEVPKEKALSLFGTQPVKRVDAPKAAKKEVKLEFEDDEEFALALSQVEEVASGDIQTPKVEPRAHSMSPECDSPPSPPKKEEKKNKRKISPSPEKSERYPSLAVSKKKAKLDSPVKQNGAKPSSEKSPSKSPAKTLTKTPKVKPEPPRRRPDPAEKSPSKSPVKTVKKNPEVKPETPRRPPEPKPAPDPAAQLWVDRYKPTSLKQIIGQQGDKSNVKKLVRWLENWEKNNKGTNKPKKPAPWVKDDTGAAYKAALLSGPPGIGKTTTAHLVCKELGFDVVEFNASDTRSKKLLGEEVSELLTSKSLSNFVHGQGDVSKKHALVMDEVDGMAGNEDRGGVQELINLIKNSKIPVICMCNDRNHPKIRSLANHCFDLRFHKPRVDQIKGAMMSICFKEKLKVKPETLADIITSTNNDIRLVLNHLSVLATKSGDLENATKHTKLGPWDVLRKIFSEEDHKKMSIYDKSDLFFHDYSITPLFVHENYLHVVPHSKKASSKRGKMELFAKASSSLCNGDLIEAAIRSNNAWSLLPTQAMFSSVIPGDVLEGHVGAQINFPAWFGKNSRQGKLDRLCQEIQVHTRLKTSGGKESVRLDYAGALRERIMRPLLVEGTDGVPSSLETLHEYSLLREDVESLMEITTWPERKDPFSAIDSKVKAAFTRAYNKAPVLTPFSIAAPVKKGRGKTQDELPEGEEWEREDEEEDEDKDDITNDGMIKVKTAAKKKEPAESNNEPSTSKGKAKGGGKRGKK